MTSTATTVVICLPADAEPDWFSGSEILHRHRLPTGTPRPCYPVRRRGIRGRLTRFSTRHLIHPVRRFGTVTTAAGGRKSRLDLTAAVTRAHTIAAYRWRIWRHVVHGTPHAHPYRHFLAQHTARPARISEREARRRFEDQPRVVAMLTHNCHPLAQAFLDPYELDAYQAGEATYTVLHWQQAVVGDAFITDDAALLEPASASLADRLRYLSAASAHLRALPRDHHVLALTVTV